MWAETGGAGAGAAAVRLSRSPLGDPAPGLGLIPFVNEMSSPGTTTLACLTCGLLGELWLGARVQGVHGARELHRLGRRQDEEEPRHNGVDAWNGWSKVIVVLWAKKKSPGGLWNPDVGHSDRGGWGLPV